MNSDKPAKPREFFVKPSQDYERKYIYTDTYDTLYIGIDELHLVEHSAFQALQTELEVAKTEIQRLHDKYDYQKLVNQLENALTDAREYKSEWESACERLRYRDEELANCEKLRASDFERLTKERDEFRMHAQTNAEVVINLGNQVVELRTLCRELRQAIIDYNCGECDELIKKADQVVGPQQKTKNGKCKCGNTLFYLQVAGDKEGYACGECDTLLGESEDEK